MWKDIKGFEGYYQVSDYGLVKSLSRTIIRNNNPYKIQERILSPAKHKSGYLYVMLSKDGLDYMKKVHRLVAEAFIPNPNNLPCVNHKDENKRNNLSSNLEWCTIGYNANYSQNTIKAAKSIAIKIVSIDKEGNKILYDSANLAARYVNGDASAIIKVAKFINKTHRGYVWRYASMFTKEELDKMKVIGYD